MTTDNNNNDIIVAAKSNNIIVSKPIGITESGLWNIFVNEETGKKTYKPTDAHYFNKYYHASNTEITCDICGKVIIKKIAQHKKTNKCRLTHFIQK
jgi:L-ascorbate metabolism protein UlaG (beta-lactamase superfamily)